MTNRRQSEASLRFEGRRQREDDAPRLLDEVPRLESLRVEFEEFIQGGTVPLFTHTRIVVVARAPAMFEVPCSEAACDGVHRLTHELLRGLRSSHEQLHGESQCLGVRNNETCRRRMHYTALARYR